MDIARSLTTIQALFTGFLNCESRREHEFTEALLPIKILNFSIDRKRWYSIASERLILKHTGVVSQSRLLRVFPSPCHKGLTSMRT